MFSHSMSMRAPYWDWIKRLVGVAGTFPAEKFTSFDSPDSPKAFAAFTAQKKAPGPGITASTLMLVPGAGTALMIV